MYVKDPSNVFFHIQEPSLWEQSKDLGHSHFSNEHVFSFSATTFKSRKTVLKLILAICVYTSFWVTTPLVGWGAYGLEPFGTSCAIKWHAETTVEASYLIAMSICVFILPLCSMCVSYCKVYRHILRTLCPSASKLGPLDVVQKSSIEKRLTLVRFYSSFHPLNQWTLIEKRKGKFDRKSLSKFISAMREWLLTVLVLWSDNHVPHSHADTT